MFVLVFLVRQPELDSRASCIVQACRFRRRFEFELPTHVHRQTRIVLQECSCFHVSFQLCRRARTFLFVRSTSGDASFRLVASAGRNSLKMINIVDGVCVCVLGTASWICYTYRTIGSSCSMEPTKGALKCKKKKNETEKKLNETAPRPPRFVSEVSCPHMCVNQWLADLCLHNFQLSLLLLPRPQIVLLCKVHTWW